jgi:hypothetical protein
MRTHPLVSEIRSKCYFLSLGRGHCIGSSSTGQHRTTATRPHMYRTAFNRKARSGNDLPLCCISEINRWYCREFQRCIQLDVMHLEIWSLPFGNSKLLPHALSCSRHVRGPVLARKGEHWRRFPETKSCPDQHVGCAIVRFARFSGDVHGRQIPGAGVWFISLQRKNRCTLMRYTGGGSLMAFCFFKGSGIVWRFAPSWA